MRHGCFCAHPLVAELLGLGDATIARLSKELRAGRRPPLPGAVRASLGLGSTAEDVDRLLLALAQILESGPHAHYERDPLLDEYRPAAVLA